MTIDNSEFRKLPQAAVPILKYLDYYGKKTQKELIHLLDLPIRKVRYGVTRLLDNKYIQRVPNLKDMRSVYYQISPEVANVEALCVFHENMASGVER